MTVSENESLKEMFPPEEPTAFPIFQVLFLVPAPYVLASVHLKSSQILLVCNNAIKLALQAEIYYAPQLWVAQHRRRDLSNSERSQTGGVHEL